MFENQQVEVDAIPDFNDIHWEGLNRNYFRASLISTGVFFLIPLSVYIVNLYANYDDFPKILALGIPVVLLLAMLITLLIASKAFYKKGYALREKDVYYKEGLFWQSMICIPFNRVQHCEVKQGPIDRYFGLAKLYIYTAGGSSSDLVIPGLTLDKAHSIKAYILNKTVLDDEQE